MIEVFRRNPLTIGGKYRLRVLRRAKEHFNIAVEKRKWLGKNKLRYEVERDKTYESLL